MTIALPTNQATTTPPTPPVSLILTTDDRHRQRLHKMRRALVIEKGYLELLPEGNQNPSYDCLQLDWHLQEAIALINDLLDG